VHVLLRESPVYVHPLLINRLQLLQCWDDSSYDLVAGLILCKLDADGFKGYLTD